jgi:hypothetical protein
MWIKFAATVFIKTFDIDNQYNNFDDSDKTLINKEIIEKLNCEMCKTRHFVTTLIKNNWNLSSEPNVIRAKEYITKLENTRPRRNLKTIDYTGMDTIEPRDEFDIITNIWADLTIYKDPDYEFEDDEDDDEDDEDDEDGEDEDSNYYN